MKRDRREWLMRVRALFIHLRLHFQILLSPIFLWGYFLTGAPLDAQFWLAYVAYHIFLYGGVTAYNSFYDRDEGPVGGLEQPPPVRPELLPFSLIVLGTGLVLAALVNLPFVLFYLLFAGMCTAYSHPSLRWKSHPLGGLFVVGIGQGIFASLAGWSAAQPDLTAIPPLAWLAMLGVSLVTLGFYPITQIYQIDEDRARGDITFAVWAGPHGSFVFSITVQVLGLAVALWAIARLLGTAWAIWVGVFYTLLLFVTVQWARTFDGSQVIANYRRVMRIYWLTSSGFLGLLCVQFASR